VVMVIVAIMAALGYGTLNNLLRQREAIEASMDRIANEQRAFMRLRNDIQNLRARPIRDQFGDPQPAFLGAEEAGIEFTRGGYPNPLNAPRANLERIGYVLSGEKLLRRSWRVLDRAQDSVPLEATVMDGITELHWRFLAANLEWAETWPDPLRRAPVPGTEPPPLAVELTMETRALGEVRLLFAIGRDAGAEVAAPGTNAQLDGSDGERDTPDDGEDTDPEEDNGGDDE